MLPFIIFCLNLQCFDVPALYWVPHVCTEAHISNFSIKTFYNFYYTLINLLEQISVKKDLDEGKEICFDLLQNSQGNTINSRPKKKKKKKNGAKKSQHAAKENEFTPEQRKTRPQNKPGKSRENEGTERDAPSQCLGICQFHLSYI